MKTTSREEYFLAEELKDREIITQPVLHERHPYWYAQLSKRKVGEVAYWVGIKPIKTLELKRRVSRTCFQAYLSWKAAFSLFAETNYTTCRLFAWLMFCGMILNISKADPGRLQKTLTIRRRKSSAAERSTLLRLGSGSSLWFYTSNELHEIMMKTDNHLLINNKNALLGD